MQDDVVALFAYDRWANTKVFDACRKLTAEQYAAEPVPGWSSVRSTISHIALATEYNLRTLAGGPVVVQDELNKDERNPVLKAYDLRTGKLLWQRPVAGPGQMVKLGE